MYPEAKTTSVSMVVDPDRMIHPDEARATIFRYLWRLPGEQISLGEAPWRVLSDNLVAAEDQPPFAAATMDGYAVVADDPSPWREIVAAVAVTLWPRGHSWHRRLDHNRSAGAAGCHCGGAGRGDRACR